MAKRRRRRSRGAAPKKRRRIIRVVERVILGAVMGTVAFVAERLMIRALKKSGTKVERPREAQLSTSPEKVHDKTAG